MFRLLTELVLEMTTSRSSNINIAKTMGKQQCKLPSELLLFFSYI